MFEEIVDFFEKSQYKNITINQMGFIESQFYINSAKFEIKQDILTLKNEERVYIKLNINQIYNINYLDDGIILYLDNDTKIKFII